MLKISFLSLLILIYAFEQEMDAIFERNGTITDSHGKKVKYYTDVPKVLENLYNKGFILAVASRTSEIQGADELLKLFDWDKYFTYKEIYPGCKVNHFNRFKSKSGLDFNQMLFFDDEYRNKLELQKIGVLTILVENGVTEKLLDDGLAEYEKFTVNGK